jgi:hypothetical protein
MACLDYTFSADGSHDMANLWILHIPGFGHTSPAHIVNEVIVKFLVRDRVDELL